MSEDQNPPETKPEKPVKTDSSSTITKLLILLAIVFALTKWGVPFMNEMVDKFKKTQKEKTTSDPEKKLTSDEPLKSEIAESETSDEDKLKLAIENAINQWRQKEAPDSSVTVKFINANDDQSRLAVEYVETNAAGETQSKELLFTKDEFGIYIYEEAGIRQIRVRQPK